MLTWFFPIKKPHRIEKSYLMILQSYQYATIKTGLGKKLTHP